MNEQGQRSQYDVLNSGAEKNMDIGPITEIVIQPTTFCNLRCSYCYLSEEARASKLKMSIDTPADIIQYVIDTGLANENLVIIWHAGEPMSIGVDFYRQAIGKINSVLPDKYKIVHTIQTNATYMNKEWIKFFKEFDFKIGVSIDGPKELTNAYRKTAGGFGAYDLTMRGINMLRDNQIKFDTISVVTKEALDQSSSMYEFFQSIGSKFMGLNAEETEAYNTSKLNQKENFLAEYKNFFKQLYFLQKDQKLKIREIEETKSHILNTDQDVKSLLNIPFFFFNVDYQGNFSTYSPELLGATHDRYPDFVLGNIYKDSFASVLASKKYIKMRDEVAAGMNACKKECEYFFLCGGGSPSNKLFENNSFDSTETFFCQAKTQIPISIITNDLIESSGKLNNNN